MTSKKGNKPMKTVDISGFGGGYEATCQKMLRNGITFLEEHPDFSFAGYRQYTGIYGVCTAEDDQSKALDVAIMKNIDDCTGAMHQAVVNHLAHIHRLGYDGWLVEAEKHGCTLYDINDGVI